MLSPVVLGRARIRWPRIYIHGHVNRKRRRKYIYVTLNNGYLCLRFLQTKNFQIIFGKHTTSMKWNNINIISTEATVNAERKKKFILLCKFTIFHLLRVLWAHLLIQLFERAGFNSPSVWFALRLLSSMQRLMVSFVHKCDCYSTEGLNEQVKKIKIYVCAFWYTFTNWC